VWVGRLYRQTSTGTLDRLLDGWCSYVSYIEQQRCGLMTFLAAVIVFICIYYTSIVPSCLVSCIYCSMLQVVFWLSYYVFWLLALFQKYSLKRVHSLRNETHNSFYCQNCYQNERHFLITALYKHCYCSSSLWSSILCLVMLRFSTDFQRIMTMIRLFVVIILLFNSFLLSYCFAWTSQGYFILFYCRVIWSYFVLHMRAALQR